MNNLTITSIIENKIRAEAGKDGSVSIPLKKGTGRIHVKLSREGVMVSNLANQPFLPWAVFEETVELIKRNSGKAIKGDAMNGKLGTAGCPSIPLKDILHGRFMRRSWGKQFSEGLHRLPIYWSGRGYVIMRGESWFSKIKIIFSGAYSGRNSLVQTSECGIYGTM